MSEAVSEIRRFFFLTERTYLNIFRSDDFRLGLPYLVIGTCLQLIKKPISPLQSSQVLLRMFVLAAHQMRITMPLLGMIST